MTRTAIELFAGMGGATEGLRRAGIHVVAAVDRWPAAIEAHRRWHQDVPVVGSDVAKWDPRSVPPPWLLWSSPSCKPWSMANRTPKRGRAHPEYFPLVTLLDLWQRSGARWLVVENVCGLIWSKEGKIEMAGFYAEVARRGLRAAHSVVHSNSVGVAQIRRRVFIVAGPDYVRIHNGSDYVPPEGIELGIIDASNPTRHANWTRRATPDFVRATTGHDRPGCAKRTVLAMPSNGDMVPAPFPPGAHREWPRATRGVLRDDRHPNAPRASKRGDPYCDGGTGRTLAACCALQQVPMEPLAGFTKRVAHELVGNAVCPPLAEHVARVLLKRDAEIEARERATA